MLESQRANVWSCESQSFRLGQRRSGEKGWQLQYESILEHQRDWQHSKERFPDHHLCVGGDFNQRRDGRRWGKWNRQWYGTNQGRNQLTECLTPVPKLK